MPIFCELVTYWGWTGTGWTVSWVIDWTVFGVAGLGYIFLGYTNYTALYYCMIVWFNSTFLI